MAITFPAKVGRLLSRLTLLAVEFRLIKPSVGAYMTRVAIVGNAQGVLADDGVIDDYDLVVRINHGFIHDFLRGLY